MPGPLQTRRRANPRREALLAAAVEVVGTNGLAGTTHRTVTEAAGVPLATASYYFSSIGELVAEALRAFVAGRAAEMAAPDLGELHGVLTPGDIAGWYAAKVMELDGPHRLAFYEVLVNASRAPELAGPARDALRTYGEAAQAGLRAVGAPADERQSRAYVALALGFGLLHLVDPAEDDTDQLYEAIRDLFLGQERAATDPVGVGERLATPAS
jgi:TetR/AcrR family transcriptional regulator, regulator of biofilm formation and stress response